MVLSEDSKSNNNVEVDVNVLLRLLDAQIQANAELQKTNQALSNEVHLLNEKLSYFTNRFFGRSKETADSGVSGQLNLFSDTSEETVEQSLSEEARETEVKSHKRTLGQKAAKIAHLPLKEAHHENYQWIKESVTNVGLK